MSAVFYGQVLASMESVTLRQSATSRCLSALLGWLGREVLVLNGLGWKKINQRTYYSWISKMLFPLIYFLYLGFIQAESHNNSPSYNIKVFTPQTPSLYGHFAKKFDPQKTMKNLQNDAWQCGQQFWDALGQDIVTIPQKTTPVHITYATSHTTEQGIVCEIRDMRQESRKFNYVPASRAVQTKWDTWHQWNLGTTWFVASLSGKIWQTMGTPAINAKASQSRRRPAPQAILFLEGASASESDFAWILSGFLIILYLPTMTLLKDTCLTYE